MVVMDLHLGPELPWLEMSKRMVETNWWCVCAHCALCTHNHIGALEATSLSSSVLPNSRTAAIDSIEKWIENDQERERESCGGGGGGWREEAERNTQSLKQKHRFGLSHNSHRRNEKFDHINSDILLMNFLTVCIRCVAFSWPRPLLVLLLLLLLLCLCSLLAPLPYVSVAFHPLLLCLSLSLFAPLYPFASLTTWNFVSFFRTFASLILSKDHWFFDRFYVLLVFSCHVLSMWNEMSDGDDDDDEWIGWLVSDLSAPHQDRSRTKCFGTFLFLLFFFVRFSFLFLNFIFCLTDFIDRIVTACQNVYVHRFAATAPLSRTHDESTVCTIRNFIDARARALVRISLCQSQSPAIRLPHTLHESRVLRPELVQHFNCAK